MLNQLTTFAAEESGIGALGINFKAIIFQAGTFIILFMLIRKFALDKIAKNLKTREDTINEGLVNAQKAAKASEQALEEQGKLLSKARKEADHILAKANEEAGAIIKQAEDDAQKTNERLVNEARQRIDNEIEQARNDLKNEVTELVAEASERLLYEKIDRKKDEQLLQKVLKG